MCLCLFLFVVLFSFMLFCVLCLLFLFICSWCWFCCFRWRCICFWCFKEECCFGCCACLAFFTYKHLRFFKFVLCVLVFYFCVLLSCFVIFLTEVNLAFCTFWVFDVCWTDSFEVVGPLHAAGNPFSCLRFWVCCSG